MHILSRPRPGAPARRGAEMIRADLDGERAAARDSSNLERNAAFVLGNASVFQVLHVFSMLLFEAQLGEQHETSSPIRAHIRSRHVCDPDVRAAVPSAAMRCFAA